MDVSYTTTNAIRAALGVTDREVKDNQITDLAVADMVNIELKEVYPAHAALKQKIDDDTATPEEEFTWSILLQYVKYEAAAFMLPQFQTLIVQKISDGDAEMSRFQATNLQDTLNRILTMRDKYRGMLQIEGGALPQETLSMFSVVTPTYDPVTNEGGEEV